MFFYRNLLKIGLVTFLFIYFITHIAIAQSWVGGGPSFKKIKAVSQSPTNPNLIYAGAFGWGVFKSTDGGASWINLKLGLSNTHVRSIFAISDNIVFAGTNDGVFKTTNGGSTWTSSLVTLNSVRSLAYDSKTGTSYAATYGSGLYKSTNQGTSWTAILVTDPSTGETMSHLWSVKIYGRDSIYVGGSILDIVNGGSLFNSNNGGISWTQVQYPTGIRSSVHSIAISPNEPVSSLIIGTAAKGVYKSTNGGLNWSDINAGTTPNPIADNQIKAVGFSTNYQYAGTDSLGKFYYRSLGDVSTGWLSGTGLPGTQAVLSAIEIIPSSQNIIYLGTEGQGVYKSVDSGFTWQSQNSGMLGTAGRVIRLNGNGQIILGTDLGDGIWLSTNQSANWMRADTLTTSNSITSIGVTNNNLILYAGDYGTGVYKSTDGGHIWHITDSTTINHFTRTLAVNPTNSNLVYAGTGNGVYKTSNGGTSWFATNNGLPFATSVRSMEMDPTNSNTIYIGTDSSYMYKTTDAGASWIHFTNLNGFLPQDLFIRSITVDHTTPSQIYVGADSGRIYKSTTSGASWSLLVQLPATHSVRRILINPNNSMILFAATFGDGIFISVDQGIHWTSYNSGLPDLDVYTLESDNATPLNIYAGTGSHGVFHITYTYLNHPPVLSPIGSKTIPSYQSLAFTVSATDSDGTIPFLSVHGLLTGATFVDHLNGLGSFSWVPTMAQVGNYFLTFKASDGVNVDSEVVAISVINRKPILATIGNRSVLTGHSLSFTISSTDSDGTTPLLSAHPLPAGATFIDSANGHGQFNWIPLPAQIGSYPLIFVSSDGMLADSQLVTIDVFDSTGFTSSEVSLDAGWNLISVPIKPIDPRKTSIFPTYVSAAFAYSGQYLLRDSLTYGDGYWLKSSIPQIVHVIGSRLNQDTINVSSGWNLIGSISSTIPVTKMTAISPTTITSPVYGYSPTSGYSTADSLNIGKGFWVKVSNSGKLILTK